MTKTYRLINEGINMKFTRSVSRLFAVATLACAGLLAGAGTATAATVISDGTNASGILGLQVKGVLYDVDFIKIDGDLLYGIDPPIYDFNEEETIQQVMGACLSIKQEIDRARRKK